MQSLARDRRAAASGLSVDDVLPNALFEQVRPRLRPLVSDMRRRRRHRMEPHCTIVFENRETVLWQIQEVLRVEGRTKRRHVVEEVAHYEALLPRPGELRATVLVDGGPTEKADRFCESLASDPRALELRVGSSSCFAQCVDECPLLSSPVRYMRFPVAHAAIRALELANRPVALIAHRPSYAAARLSQEATQALATDLWISELLDESWSSR